MKSEILGPGIFVPCGSAEKLDGGLLATRVEADTFEHPSGAIPEGEFIGEHHIEYSIAISLKRIADAAERAENRDVERLRMEVEAAHPSHMIVPKLDPAEVERAMRASPGSPIFVTRNDPPSDEQP